VAFAFDVVLFAQSDNQIKTSPTIAAGDFVIAKASGTGDLGATANLTTLPSEVPASSGIVKVWLSATEMEADRVFVKWHDASGAQWHGGAVEILTTGQTFDAMDANIDTALTRMTADRAGYLDKLNVSGTLAHSDAANTYKADVSSLALETTAQSILTDTAEIGAAGAGLTALATQTSVNDLPTNSELATALASADDAVLAAIGLLNNLSSAGAQSAAAAALAAYGAATGADVAALNDLSAADVRAAVGLAAANLDAQLTDLPTGAELTAALADLPTNAELSARTLAAADYFDPATDPVATVTTVGTVTNPVTAGTVADKTGYALSGAGVSAVQSGLATSAAIAALTDVTAAEILAAWDAATVDGTITRAQFERILLAFAGGETTGAGTDDLAFLGQDGATERIAATMSGGNRSAVVLDGA
jgi:hypothetical protein